MKRKKLLISIFLLNCSIFPHVVLGQTVIANVDSNNALAFGNSKKLAIDSNRVLNLVFHDKGEIYFTESRDNADNWLTPINLSLNSGVSQFSSLAIDSIGCKHIVWQDNTIPDQPGQFDDKIRIYYKNFIDVDDIQKRFAILIGESVGNSLNPAIAVDSDGKLYVAWAAFMGLNLGWEINYSEGTLIGLGLTGSYDWTFPEIPGNALGIGSSFFPTIGTGSNIHFITWLEFSPTEQIGNFLKFKTQSEWSNIINLSQTAIGPIESYAGIPSMFVELNAIAHSVFQEVFTFQNNDFNDIYYITYEIGDTLEFQSGQNVSQASAESKNPVITGNSNGRLYAAWQQDLDNRSDIYWSLRNDDQWSTPENVSLSEENSIFPQIIPLPDDSLLIVWVEGNTTPFRIVSKKIKSTVTKVEGNDSFESNNNPVRLIQNYPNPFNGETTIRYKIPGPGAVVIIIYDMAGREVIQLMDQQTVLPGEYSVTWNGRNSEGIDSSSGVYWVQFRSGTFINTKKMILLR